MATATPRVILVTGVSRGLGRALTEKFAALGHTVLGCARNSAAVSELATRFGAPHEFRALDVTDDAAVAAWARDVAARQQIPDLIINNAAVINRSAPLWELSASEFDRVIDVNIKGVANVIRHFVPLLIQRKRGVIANLSSGWGRSTSPDVAPYCATKYAIEGLTQALAQELPPGLVAVPVNPGIIDTDMLQSCFGGSANGYEKPAVWAERAAPFFLSLSARDNGRSLSVP